MKKNFKNEHKNPDPSEFSPIKTMTAPRFFIDTIGKLKVITNGWCVQKL